MLRKRLSGGTGSLASENSELLPSGLLAVTVGLPLVGLVLSRLYHLEFPPVFLLAGALLALPVYFYIPVVYALFKADRQRVVVGVTVLGIAVSVLFNLWWLPALGMLGAALAAAVAQWVMGAVYLLLGWRLREPQP